MLVIYSGEREWADLATWPAEDVARMTGYMNELNRELAETGEWVDGQGLGGPRRAMTVRARPGEEPLVTDGPFVEAKEVLAGYLVVDVASPERAVEIAARISAAPGKGGVPSNGPIEMHPVMDGPDVDPQLLAPYRANA